MDRLNFILGIFYLYLTLLSISADDTLECDKKKCPGPTVYYEDLQCQPLYKDPDDCCPFRYNCDHLKMRSPDKCYANGHVYSIGDLLREEDSNPCDIACVCRKQHDVAQFSCAVVDCPSYNLPNVNCYLAQNVSECCPGPIICPEKPEDRATCEVDGKIYRDGESFVSELEPNKSCVCGPGYTGENVAPFCRDILSISPCRIESFHANSIQNNTCVPTYYHDQSPQKDCNVAFRCQNDKDEVIRRNRIAPISQHDDEMTCQFGTLVMGHGDELNNATDYSSVCVRCVCEVGPIPTCIGLSDEECDITKHPEFYNFDE